MDLKDAKALRAYPEKMERWALWDPKELKANKELTVTMAPWVHPDPLDQKDLLGTPGQMVEWDLSGLKEIRANTEPTAGTVTMDLSDLKDFQARLEPKGSWVSRACLDQPDATENKDHRE